MPSEENIDDEKKGDIIEMQYLYCWKCGKSIPVNSKFCLECGSDVKNPKVKDDDADKAPDKTIEIKSNNGNRKNIFIVVGGLAILAIVGGAVVINNGFDKIVASIDNSVQPSVEAIDETIESDVDTNSKCGPGTVFGDTTNTCMIP
ncbi:zinc ribbon domain-containing protein [Nitrosopumilus sp. Nsub]|uniref:zinc-ribbon domain-containing protein n=1 Tax=Nitrosopumilus sp. Nsub TaxID=1776294 RepID=UPI000832541E|nr:zinc ribbon domain-containing protein [Nitrosopumilus sp. Nsub]